MTRDPARDGDPLVDGVETAVSAVPDDAPETTYASRTWSIRPGVPAGHPDTAWPSAPNRRRSTAPDRNGTR